MPIQALLHPLAYRAEFEKPETDEAQTSADLAKTLHKISETTFKDSGRAMRSVHAKGHGIVRGELTVAENLPPEYAQGIFARPGIYETVMRFSTTPGDILDDRISTPRGLGLKILHVPGTRLEGSEESTEQDFLMVNGPAFSAPTARSFLNNLRLLALTTDKAEGLKKALAAALRGIETTIEVFGGESGTLKSLGGHPETNLLGETFFTQVPVLYGAYMAKLRLAPASPALKALKDAKVDMAGKPDALRGAVADFFRANDAVWEIQVQLCLDIGSMPIEDSTVAWPEDKSPFVTVGRILAAAQNTWDRTAEEQEDALYFNPWNAVSDHRPIGSIMRARKESYAASASFRAEHNGCPIHSVRRLFTAASPENTTTRV